MDEFLQVFGNLTVASVAVVIAALVFVWKLYTIAKNHMIERYKKEEEKERKVQQIIEQASHYPEWRKQSLDIQKSLWEAIDTVKKHSSITSSGWKSLREKSGRAKPPPVVIESFDSTMKFFTSRDTPKNISIRFSMILLATRSIVTNTLSMKTTKLLWRSKMSKGFIRNVQTKTLSCKGGGLIWTSRSLSNRLRPM